MMDLLQFFLFENVLLFTKPGKVRRHFMLKLMGFVLKLMGFVLKMMGLYFN